MPRFEYQFLNSILSITNFTKNNLTDINNQLSNILENTEILKDKWGDEDAGDAEDITLTAGAGGAGSFNAARGSGGDIILEPGIIGEVGDGSGAAERDGIVNVKSTFEVNSADGLTVENAPPAIVINAGTGGVIIDAFVPVPGGDGGIILFTTGDGATGAAPSAPDGSGGNLTLATGPGGNGNTGGYGGDIILAPSIVGSSGPGNVIMVEAGGAVFIGDSTSNTNATLLTVYGNITASNFIDLTPATSLTKEESLQSILDINSVDGKIDHKTLPNLAKANLSYQKDVNCKIEKVKYTWEEAKALGLSKLEFEYEVCDKEWVEVEGRSLGGMITILVEGFKGIVDRITGAEERLDSLESENDLLKTFQQDICREENAKYNKYDWCDLQVAIIE